ncbi:MAG: phosphonate ABC transporter, permease protein PhnE, partial [Acidovorax sp.]|nr:phosphonate ABC transporter, permease protein PhnE [Acidovorax sp.]
MSTTPAPTVTPRLPATVGAAASKQGLGWHLSWALLLALLAISWKGADMRPADLVRDSGNMATYLADFFP